MSSYDEPELTRWMQQAASALATSRTSAARSWGCFLAEQAAQLAIKGILHAVGEHDTAWGHDLVLLERRAREVFGRDWPGGLDEPAARLARHYIPARYPDAHAGGAPEDRYTEADATQARGDAERLLAAVDAMTELLDQVDQGDRDDAERGDD